MTMDLSLPEDARRRMLRTQGATQRQRSDQGRPDDVPRPMTISDAVIALRYSGAFDQAPAELRRKTLCAMCQKNDSAIRMSDLTVALDEWGIRCGRNGVVITADLRAAVDDGRITPSSGTMVYQSDINAVTGTDDPQERVDRLYEIIEREQGRATYHLGRIERFGAWLAEAKADLEAQRGPISGLQPDISVGPAAEGGEGTG